jgi:hypothetical protein
MRLLKALLPVALVLAGAGSTGAADPPAGDELLAVGATGIYCLRAPCPWRGIRATENATGIGGRLLWWGETLPLIAAKTSDQRRLAAAWDNHVCLLVHGRFERGVLAVSTIAGKCP